MHLTLRAQLYRLGLALGDRLVEALAAGEPPPRGARLRAVAAASAGGLAASLAIAFGAHRAGVGGWLLAGGCLALGGAATFWWPGRFPYAVLYRGGALAVAAGPVCRIGERCMSSKSAVEGEFEIINALGLHARAAAQLVKLANRYKCEVDARVREARRSTASPSWAC